MPAVVADTPPMRAAAIYFGLHYLGDAVADTPFMRISEVEEGEK